MEKIRDFVPDATDNKLILLFILEKMEIPLTENSIIDICTHRNCWLTYMDCKDILWQLEEIKFVYRPLIDGGETKYAITAEGQNCVGAFYERIPNSIREEITAFAKEYRLHFKRLQEYVPTYTKEKDGNYLVQLKIKGNISTQPLFEIKLRVNSRKTAIDICKKWVDKAPNVYEFVLSNLVEED